jgi:hypothetical protein
MTMITIKKYMKGKISKAVYETQKQVRIRHAKHDVVFREWYLSTESNGDLTLHVPYRIGICGSKVSEVTVKL